MALKTSRFIKKIFCLVFLACAFVVTLCILFWFFYLIFQKANCKFDKYFLKDMELNRVRMKDKQGRPKDYEFGAEDKLWTGYKGSPFPLVAEAIQVQEKEKIRI